MSESTMSKTTLAALLSTCLLLGCGGEPAEERQAATPAGEAKQTAPKAQAKGDPCAPLNNDPVRYDPTGKPMGFGFEYPGGWEVNESFYAAGVSSVDIVTYLDPDRRSPDYVLRFGHSLKQANDNAPGLVEVWRKLPVIDGVEEVPVGDRTLYIARTRMGEIVGYQALFPAPDSETSAWLVSGGVTRAPDGCEEESVAAVERILRSMTPNQEIGEPPE